MIPAALSALWSRFSGWIMGAGAILAALGAAWLKGRSDATQRERLRQAEEATRAAGVRVDVENTVAGVDDPLAELRREGWTRPMSGVAPDPHRR